MANPTIVAIPTSTWTKVATNVTRGFIHRVNQNTTYLQTYRLTGQAAPIDFSEAIRMFEQTTVEEISAQAGIDVYVCAAPAAGEIRVDV
jgi:hypothetical protein